MLLAGLNEFELLLSHRDRTLIYKAHHCEVQKLLKVPAKLVFNLLLVSMKYPIDNAAVVIKDCSEVKVLKKAHFANLFVSKEASCNVFQNPCGMSVSREIPNCPVKIKICFCKCVTVPFTHGLRAAASRETFPIGWQFRRFLKMNLDCSINLEKLSDLKDLL